jgi:glyoxylase-like metal-dependent hydrolase (beta-lactamase superfamily II)
MDASGVPYLRQFVHEEAGCLSYVVGCPSKSVCAVVDPRDDIQPYIDLASRERFRITHVFDTHAHADHISGTRKLAAAVGAPLYLHKSAPVRFPFTPVRHGDVLRIGNQPLQVVHTPGHTPESVTYLFSDSFLLTGDTLLVGNVGRLDLEGAGTVEQLYDSVFNKLLGLGDHLGVLPAHFGRSLCGSGLSPVPYSTLGIERRTNFGLQARSLDDFRSLVGAVLEEQPSDYRRIKHINER